MTTSATLRSLSSLSPARLSPSPVAPLPVRGSFDGWLAEELRHLQRRHSTSITWALHALDVAASTQKKTIELIATNPSRGTIDRSSVEDYLGDVVELLDACNSLRERTDAMVQYARSLQAALHCLEGRTKQSETALERARVALAACDRMEKSRCTELEKLSPRLRRKKRLKKTKPCSTEMGRPCKNEFHEVLGASKAMGVLVCGLLSIFLSFKVRRGVGVTQLGRAESWVSSLQELKKVVKEGVKKGRKGGGPVLDELRWTVEMARDLRGVIQGQGSEVCGKELRDRVEVLGRRAWELEGGIKMIEGGVNELYRHLISIRVALLGILTMA